tara:strand:- start:72019 stop:73122 length:1104 start_codon:yes stop_codon:yes gene_type:complete
MRIAIFGCGQLARMLALAGWPMGMRFSFVADEAEDTRCVDGLGTIVHLQNSMSAHLLYTALGEPDVITVEKEAVNTALLQQLSQHCEVAPNPEILWIVQHRARQKQFLSELKIPTAPYVEMYDKQQLLFAAESLGYPLIIKSCEQGYDGQQQWRIHDKVDARAFIDGPAKISHAVVEKMLDFTVEVSILAVRNMKGDVAVYAPSENKHRNGTLSVSIAPTEVLHLTLRKKLESIMNTLMSSWDYVGVLAVECFVVDDQIIVNELAPRVHNSGHWTQDGAVCSQFENHLRAISGQNLGSTASLGHCAMINLLGCKAPEELSSLPQAHLHWYDKTLRQGRKMGHINLLHQSADALQLGLSHAQRLLANE